MVLSEIDRIEQLSEEEFTKEYVIPLLTQLGYKGLRYTHGTSEYGIDVIGYELTKLETRRYVGAQVKKGSIRGTVKVQGIILQARASFTNPFKDVITLDGYKINELYVISSGKITHNAKNQILNGIMDLKGNIHFLDGQDVLNYLYKEKPDDISLDLNSYFLQVFDLLNEKYREALSNNDVESSYSVQYYLNKLKLQMNCTIYYININVLHELQIGTHQYIPLTKGMTCLIFQNSSRENMAVRYSNYTTLQDYMYLVQTKSIINIPEYLFIEGEDYQVFFFNEKIESIQPEQMSQKIFSSQLKNAEISKSEYEKKNVEDITKINLYESESIEFKREFPQNARDIAKTLISFSNTNGGKIYFGIDDDGFIVGVDEIDNIQKRVSNLARNNCEPPLHPKFSIEKIDGKDILIVNIESSNYVHRTNDGRYYKRVGSTSVDLSVDELEKIIIQRRLPVYEPPISRDISTDKVLDTRFHSKVLNNESLKQWMSKIDDILNWGKLIRFQYFHKEDRIIPVESKGLFYIPHYQSLISHMESGFKDEWKLWIELEKDVNHYFEEQVAIFEDIRCKLREAGKSHGLYEYYHKPGREQPINYVNPINISETVYRESERRLSGFEIKWFAENLEVKFFMAGDTKVWEVSSSGGSLIHDIKKENADFIYDFMNNIVKSSELVENVSLLLEKKKEIDDRKTNFYETLRKISSAITLGHNFKGKCDLCV